MSATETVPPAEAKAQTGLEGLDGRRLYIGNLAYASTEDDLRNLFKDLSIDAVSIPTNPRTQRPVGYAFVDLKTPTEVDRAIGDLNGLTILDRKVSVQLARKYEDGANSGGENTSGNEKSRQGSGRSRGRRFHGRRFHRSRNSRKENNKDASGAKSTDEGAANDENEAGLKSGAENGTAAPSKPAKDHTRHRRQRGPPEDGVPSKTKVMVANLPYDMPEDKLMEMFVDYSPEAVKIALRPIPKFMVRKLQARGEARKGRGFGFVTLATEEMQQKACSEMNGKVVEGREIAVKIAIDSPVKDEAEEAKPAVEGTEETAVAPAEVPA